MSRLARAFVGATIVAVVGFLLVQFVPFGVPPVAVAMAGAIIGIVAALPVFEAFEADEIEQVRELERAAAAATYANGWEGLGQLIADGDPNSPEYAQAIELAGRISVQTRELAHAGRARYREAQLRRAL
jgi:hypothetical protein